MAPPPVDYSLYYVTGRTLLPPGKDFFESLSEACEGGVTIVQLREKNISTKEFLELAIRGKEICDKHNVPFIINDRLDIALAVGCGLHVGQDDMPAIEARKLLGPDQILGVSVNTEAEMRQVLEQGVADYVGIGPAYDTATKKDLSTLLGTRGVSRMLAVLGESSIKAVVIGGIQPSTIPNVLRQCPAALPSGKYRGLDGLAVVSAIAASPTPRDAAEALRTLFSQGPSYPVQLQPAAASPEKIIQAASVLLGRLRKGPNPLIHHITNNVVMNDCANLTLALSASPIMSGSAQEADELGQIVGTLLLNFGTVNPAQYAAQETAGKAANRNGRPIVFDPVGVGATAFRKQHCGQLLSDVHASIIKGNAGEIGALYGTDEVKARGVDSVGTGFKDPASIVKNLARREKLVVAMSGVVDYVSDGNLTYAVENGHEYQGVITGSGCMASTAVAAFAAVSEEYGPFVAAVSGLVAINVAAEIAAARPDVKGPNTFRAALIDECYHLTPEKLVEKARVKLV
ncbi:thiamine-phosphate diphosphorylase / hydroxyethylthiazole kinase [Pseudohyphozyma bogoriensis]|nr:thiamine-phosphate diphosphorylase / hydroxyethylthiazole kinase [Pseudohyphozyma bogoriensis]